MFFVFSIFVIFSNILHLTKLVFKKKAKCNNSNQINCFIFKFFKNKKLNCLLYFTF